MRVQRNITAISWIPSEAVSGAMKMPFELGVSHYDEPPPDALAPDDLARLQEQDRFRFANRLAAWVEFDDASGRPTAFGYDDSTSTGLIGSTFVFKGRALSYNFQAFAMPDIQQPPEVLDTGAVRFVQTAGGRTGAPAPRRVRRAPFVQWHAPLAWTTLALTINADGTSTFVVQGASRFPRHWIYDSDGKLAAKSGMTNFNEWYRRAFGKHSPWGDADSPALVTAAETALERQLSSQLMRAGEKPKIRKLDAGDVLAREGEPGTELLLVLDGVVRAEKDGERLAEYGPGALLGERAILEGGTRTATLVAVTTLRVAVAEADAIDRDALREVSTGHRHEES